MNLTSISFEHFLVILSSLIIILGISAYIRDTISGRTKPNRVSWLLWGVLPIIATFAALDANADFWATIRVFLAGFLPLLVFLASFLNKNSYWKLTKFDLICGIFAVLAMTVWLIVDSPRLAILLSIIGEVFATLPTIRKAWKFPDSETGITYVTSMLSVLLVLPAIPVWNIENAGFQLYLLLANVILTTSIYRKSLRNYLKKTRRK